MMLEPEFFHDRSELGEALNEIRNESKEGRVKIIDPVALDKEFVTGPYPLAADIKYAEISTDLISIFEKNNIKPIDSLNKKLDPNFHQAMMEIEDDTKEPGTIIQEIQKGFTIKDRLLRPSLVGVSKKVTIKEEKTEENQENPENK